ncbi:saccharopine dehydrogenase [Streptomyces paludis]|uniref:Saccharopine dehydrogenase n=1 Tax=Streptomyces paludis TaxID=2282738 RepID=A0A345I134_9ACTN|nr:saccharopine dehydrogenase [Streptomyces paludis]
MSALVLGGYGAVGTHVVARLREGGGRAYAAGRDPVRADRPFDLTAGAGEAYLRALDGIDVVVNASGAEDPGLAVAATDRGIAFVDISATTPYIAALERLTPAAPLLLGVGLAPGLTGLLATALAKAPGPGPVPGQAPAPGPAPGPAGPTHPTGGPVGGPIDLAVVLGAGEKHGAAATDWSYGLLGRTFPDTHGGPPVRNYSRPRAFDLPHLGRRRLYRADFSDQHTLTRTLGVPVRTYFGTDSRAATAALALLTWLPGARRATPRGLHLPGSDGWLASATHAGTGRTVWARGRSQSRASALLAALAAHAAPALPPGVHQLTDVVTLDDVPHDDVPHEEGGITIGHATP